MPKFRPKGVLERTATSDLWKHTLSQIPTRFGRLIYLASLRDPNSGVYRHHGLFVTFGREESTRTLRESHEQVFREWLSLPIAEKAEELKSYLETIEEPQHEVAAWLTSDQLRSQAPVSARSMERELFQADVETVLEILRNDLGGGPPSRD